MWFEKKKKVCIVTTIENFDINVNKYQNYLLVLQLYTKSKKLWVLKLQ